MGCGCCPQALLGGSADVVSRLYSRVISTLNGVTLLITLLIADLLSPLDLQVRVPVPSNHALSQEPFKPKPRILLFVTKVPNCWILWNLGLSLAPTHRLHSSSFLGVRNYLGSQKVIQVIPKRKYFGAYGYRLLSMQVVEKLVSVGPACFLPRGARVSMRAFQACVGLRAFLNPKH